MKRYLSITKLYTLLLVILPSLIAISWLNVFFGNAQYTAVNYALTFVLPAIVIAYVISLLTADRLHAAYIFTYTRVLFTLVALVGSLFIFSYAFTFFGFQSLFLTAYIPSIADYDNLQVLGINSQQKDPREIASKFYSLQLMVALVLIMFFFALSTIFFKSKIKTEENAVTTVSKPKKKEVKKKVVKKKKKV